MNTVIRYELQDELLRIRNCIKHVQKRFKERFGLNITEEFIYRLSDMIMSRKFPIKKRRSSNQVWVELVLPNSKRALILFNEALMIPQTVYTGGMYRR